MNKQMNKWVGLGRKLSGLRKITAPSDFCSPIKLKGLDKFMTKIPFHSDILWQKMRVGTYALLWPSKSNVGKKIIKIRVEISEIRNRPTVKKINESKAWFFEKINIIDKLLARLIEKKKRKDTTLKRKWRHTNINIRMKGRAHHFKLYRY